MGARNGNDLAAVRARFDAWRRHKLSRRIPEDLWHDAIALLAKHSVTEICEHLGLNSWRFSRKLAELEAVSRGRKEPKAGARRAARRREGASGGDRPVAGSNGKLTNRAKSRQPVPVIDPRFVEVTPMPPLDGLDTPSGDRTGVRLVAEKSDGARLTVELPVVDAATLRELCGQFFASAEVGKPGRRR